MADLPEPPGGANGKPRPEPKRTATVFEAAPGRFILTLTTWPPRSAAVDTHYHLTMLPSDLGGLAFRVAHLEVDGGWYYHVHLNGPASTCDCRGFEAHRHCKHVESLLALQAEGQRPAAPAQAQPPQTRPAPAQPAATWGDDL